MNLNKLYELTEKEKIKIYDWQIEDCNGIYLNYDKINAIALNYDEIGTYVNEKCTLAEELGHYYCDATYTLNDDPNYIRKQEYRAKKWSYNTLIPYEKLKLAIKKGMKDLYSLANYFDVTLAFMMDTINFYTEKYGLIEC